MRDREISGQNKETEKQNRSEGAIQDSTFNYFACPKPKDLNLFYVMAIQKIGLSVF